MTRRRFLSRANSVRLRAGILAVFAITLTGRTARAEEPTESPARVEEPTFTPMPVASAPSPAPAATATALPWLAQPSTAAVFTGAQPSTPSRMMWLVLPALALGGAAMYLRLAKRRGGSPAVLRRVEVLDTARVGPKAHVVMISAGGRQLLIGVTEHSVQRLAWVGTERVAEPKAIEVAASERAKVPDGPFAHLLKSFTHPKITLNEDSDAALTIAAETKDFIERRTALTESAERTDVRPANLVKGAAAELTDLEGQVSGLRKRRAGKHG